MGVYNYGVSEGGGAAKAKCGRMDDLISVEASVCKRLPVYDIQSRAYINSCITVAVSFPLLGFFFFPTNPAVYRHGTGCLLLNALNRLAFYSLPLIKVM
jgi:hypothetical protein